MGSSDTSTPPHDGPASAAISRQKGASDVDGLLAAEPTRSAEFAVDLQPLGAGFPEEDVSFVVRALQVFYSVEVRINAPLALPHQAYYPPRARYRAEKLLDFLAPLTPGVSRGIVGLTTVDISTTKGAYADWGILGLATLSGRQCVISRFRAARGARDAEHARQRLGKTVTHEVGHMLGLPHCPNYGCLMEDGQGAVKTTDHEYDLCDACRARLGSHVRARGAAMPWPEP